MKLAFASGIASGLAGAAALDRVVDLQTLLPDLSNVVAVVTGAAAVVTLSMIASFVWKQR